MPLITPVTRCRLCKSPDLQPCLNLGNQALSGHFPEPAACAVPSGPLEIIRCTGPCGLAQLAHNYDSDALYGSHYGYRSGLNASMVSHLASRASLIKSFVETNAGQTVLDIGSNDGTFLSNFEGCDRIGIDPSSDKFSKYYPVGVTRLAKFFTRTAFEALRETRKASIVSSIAMFYDLPDPLAFARDVASIISPDGVWFLEQSYLPRMMSNVGYDSICHEHLEYYALAQIKWIAEHAGWRIIHVDFNDVNGGSFGVMMTPDKSLVKPDSTVAAAPWDSESASLTAEAWDDFGQRIASHRASLRGFFNEAKRAGKKVHGLGASTKGNVILQHCNISSSDLEVIYEVNPSKFGRMTPGTHIPIVSESEIESRKPDFLLVLPWHFRDHMRKNYPPERTHGAKLVFPLPKLEII